jgi:hypothetical protein
MGNFLVSEIPQWENRVSGLERGVYRNFLVRDKRYLILLG